MPFDIALVKQITDLEKELAKVESDLARQEAELNNEIFELYGLEDDEVRMIETR